MSDRSPEYAARHPSQEKSTGLAEGPLARKRVLITRAREQAEGLTRLLREAGAVPIALPAIRIEPPESWDPFDQSIARLHEYDWVIFTSANGVEAVVARLTHRGVAMDGLRGKKVAAIGPATARALDQQGIHADFIPSEYVAEAVAQGMEAFDMREARLLLPRAEEARDVLVQLLAGMGARVDEVPVYRTVHEAGSVREIEELLRTGQIDAVTFASSSAVRSLCSAFQKLTSPHRGPTVVCIGPVTAATATELGIRVDIVAKEYTAPGLVRALEDYFRQELEG